MSGAFAIHMDTLLNMIGTGFSVYSLRRQLGQQANLHEEEMATSTEQHFSSLSTELLAIAKEADRDVWEQRNNQFNNLLVCAVLMFGVAVGNINEGTYQFSKEDDKHGSELSSLYSRDGMFTTLSGISMGSFFLCIIACIIVMRRMSSYMIERSANLVDRLAVTMEIAHGISSAAEAQHRDNVERLLGTEKGRFHDRLGAVIGSGPKEGINERTASRKKPGGGGGGGGGSEGAAPSGEPPLKSYLPPSFHSQHSSHGGSNGGGGLPFKPSGGSYTPPLHEPPSARGVGEAPPLNFSVFYRENCVQLAHTVMLSFVIGVLSAWSAVWLLLWNQFPHLYIPIFLFFVIFGFAIFSAFYLDWRSQKQERKVARLLQNDVLRTMPVNGSASASNGHPPNGDAHAAAPPGFSRQHSGRRRGSVPDHVALADLRARLLPSPPPSPPTQQQPQQQPRPSKLRLRELDELRADGLVTEEEYAAKRTRILDDL